MSDIMTMVVITPLYTLVKQTELVNFSVYKFIPINLIYKKESMCHCAVISVSTS